MEIKKKVAIIGTAGIPAKYGGFETLAENLTRLLGGEFDFTVYCSKRKYKEKILSHNNSRLVYLPFGSNGKQSVIYDFVSMLHALFYADVMLVLGVSGGLFLPIIRFLFRGKIIINIDGLEWKRDKWRWYAKWFLRLSEAFAVWFSNIVIADHPVIQEYVRQVYRKEAKYIAYGADHVVKRPLSEELLKKYPFLKEPYALSVCRIEPENNVYMIMEAMAHPGMMNLVIIGNWQHNSGYARDLKIKFSEYHNIFMLDSVYDQVMLDQFRSNCAVYIHGHSAGGTNPSLIEAMALGCPTFTYRVIYNEVVTENFVRYFSSAQELHQLLVSVDKAQLEKIGQRMQELSCDKHTWSCTCQRYQNILGN